MQRPLRAVLALILGLTTMLVRPVSACTMVAPAQVVEATVAAPDAAAEQPQDHHHHQHAAAPTEQDPAPPHPANDADCDVAVGCLVAVTPAHAAVPATSDQIIASAMSAPEPPPPRR